MARTSFRSSPPDLRRGLRSLGRELPGVAPGLIVVALLLCLLVPIPPAIVDLLLSSNLAAAVVLLVATIRVRRTADFLGFPTLVLLLTLCRLALNVATTRLILAEADAGRVIDAFASLVIRGDLLIGAVMFGVITAIQYLVIARGAERVAEVAARFSLDGMPGQQQAIDADLRSGAISPREARARRSATAERSDLYGRMDGVMRWVKGDAVVGLLITGINLVGGVAVGTLREGLGVADSVELYGRLAIGDGLLAQLPALLIALAAALLVARVDHERERASWLEPVMLLVPAGLLGLLALVPGMPGLAFTTTSVGLLATALLLAGWRPGEDRSEADIRVRTDCDAAVQAALSKSLTGLRQRCEDTLAIEIPRLVLDTRAAPLGPGQLELRHGDRVLGRHDLGPQPGVTQLDAVLLGTFQVLMRSAASLVTLAGIELELERCRTRDPSGVRQAMRVLEPVDLLIIVRAFVRERIPAPSIDALIRLLAERRVFGDPNERTRWPEHAREALADHWVRDVLDGVTLLGTPCWIRPTVDLEDAIMARAVASDASVTVALTLAERERLCARIRASCGGCPVIVVCSGPARCAVAAALAGARPHIPTLALGELLAADVELPDVTSIDLE